MKQISGTIYFEQIPKGTSQMKRVNHRSGKFFMGKDLKLAHDLYMNSLFEFSPERPIEGPVALGLVFAYSIKDKKKRGTMKTSRPDCDNIVKLVIDVMTELGFWVDDAQICQLRVTKMWSPNESAAISFDVKEVVE